MTRVFINALILREPFAGVSYSIYRTISAIVALDDERWYSILVPRSLKRKFPKKTNVSISRSLFVGGTRPLARVFYEQAMLPFSISKHVASFAHFPAYVAPRMLFVPFVVNIHDVIPFTHPAFVKNSTVRHFKFALPRTVDRAAQIIVPSHFVKNQLLNIFRDCDPAKLSVVPFAPAHAPSELSKADARRIIREKYFIDKPFFLFTGVVEPKKNLPTLFKAFFAARAKNGFPHVLVVLGSRGWMADKTLFVSDTLRMDEILEMPGYVPEADMPAFFRAATAFCFSSFVEGFGLPILEAMQEGCPCLLSDIPVFREVAGTNAEFLPMIDIQAWRIAIENAVEGKYGSDKQEKARKAHAAKYSWERTAKETLDVYKYFER